MTRSLGWAHQYDAPFDGGFQRCLLLGDGPFFGIQLTEYVEHPDPFIAHLFDNQTECNVGLASGETMKDTLRRLCTRSDPLNRPAPLPTKAVISAFSRHKHRVVRALSEATLYRGKSKFVMWADEGAQDPSRLARCAKAWGMVPEMRGTQPVFVRHVSLNNLYVTNESRQ